MQPAGPSHTLNPSLPHSLTEEGDDVDPELSFKREVAETFLRCVKMRFDQTNVVIELNGLKVGTREREGIRERGLLPYLMYTRAASSHASSQLH